MLCVWWFTHIRYDVELYQRIEQLIGKKLPLHATVEEEVMSLMERVSEAQRHAKMVRKYICLLYMCNSESATCTSILVAQELPSCMHYMVNSVSYRIIVFKTSRWRT